MPRSLPTILNKRELARGGGGGNEVPGLTLGHLASVIALCGTKRESGSYRGQSHYDGYSFPKAPGS